MSKISKLLVMALVVLAVITMSLNVNAGTTSLTDYVTNVHNINGMIFELSNNQKTAIREYISANVTDAQADVALGKIKEAEKLVSDANVNRVENLSAEVKTKVISLATEAAKAVGLTLKVDTANNTFTVSSDSKVLASGKAESFITYQGAGSASAPASSASAAATTGSTLLYTGANYAVYAVVVLAIVAVAVVVKKRA